MITLNDFEPGMRLTIAIVLALAAGICSWVSGLMLLRSGDEATLPERWMHQRIFLTRLFTILAMVMIFLSFEYSWLTLPLFFLSTTVGGFQLRKRLFEDRWNLFGYLRHRLRITAGFGLFWIALMSAPWITVAIGSNYWPIVLIALFLLYLTYQDVLAWALGAKRLEDADHLSEFRAVVEKSKVPVPRIDIAGPRDGVWANALTLPRGSRSRILMSRTLLERCSREESVAIFAHELAHVEQWSSPQLRRKQLLSQFILPVLAVVPAALLNDPHDKILRWFWIIVWPLVLSISLLKSLARRQGRETEADLRALELGVSPDALISGLEKIHDINKLPRRFDSSYEKQMTHPSLARRIQAIRAASGAEGEQRPQSESTATFLVPSRKRGVYVRLSSQQMEIFDGVAAGGDDPPAEALLAAPVTPFPYGQIEAMHVRQSFSGPELVVVSGKKRRTISLFPHHTNAIQQHLDGVDRRFVAAPAENRDTQWRARFIAVIAFLFSLFPGFPFPAGVAALLAAIFPGRATLAAAGGSSIGVLFAWLAIHRTPETATNSKVLLFTMVMAGLGLLFMSLRIGSDQQRERSRMFVTILYSIITLASITPLLLSLFMSAPLQRAAQAAGAHPAAAVALAGCGALFLATPGRRFFGAIALIASCFAAIGGSAWLLEEGKLDPLANGAEISVSRPAVSPRSSATFPISFSGMRVSPDGATFTGSIYHEDEDAEDGVEVSIVGATAGGATQELADADDDEAAPLNGARVAVARSAAKEVTLELKDLKLNSLWSLHLPGANWIRGLTVDRNDHWILSVVQSKERMVRYSGMLGKPDYRQQPRDFKGYAPGMGSWDSDRETSIYAQRHYPTGDRTLWLRRSFYPPADETTLGASDSKTLRPLFTTFLHTNQVRALPDSPLTVIVASTPTHTFINLVDDQGKVKRAIRLSGAAQSIDCGSEQRVGLVMKDGRVIVWSALSGRAVLISDLRDKKLSWQEIAFFDGGIAVNVMKGETATIRTYDTAAVLR